VVHQMHLACPPYYLVVAHRTADQHIPAVVAYHFQVALGR
jgi:hypothetical protein